jgi:hypothetical protein
MERTGDLSGARRSRASIRIPSGDGAGPPAKADDLSRHPLERHLLEPNLHERSRHA